MILCHLYSVIFNWHWRCILGKSTCRYLFRNSESLKRYLINVSNRERTGQKLLIIHEQDTKEIMSVKKSEIYLVLFFCINFKFDFLVLFKMYFQNYFANRFIKLEGFTSHLPHSRPCCISSTTLAFGSSLYIRYNLAADVVNSIYKYSVM